MAVLDRCVHCGNTAESDGFYPCDASGVQVEPVEGLWSGLYVCGRCGAVQHNREADDAGFGYDSTGRRCANCDRLIPSYQHTLCSECEGEMRFIAPDGTDSRWFTGGR